MGIPEGDISTAYVHHNQRLMTFVIQQAETDESYVELFKSLVDDDPILRPVVQRIKNLVNKIHRLDLVKEQLIASIGFQNLASAQRLLLPAF